MRWDVTALRHGMRRAFRGRRGSAQLGLLVAASAVAGGMTLGHGIASRSASSGYDLAWLADGSRGQVVQVDPVLGRPNVRLQVASAGDRLEVLQGNGQLIVVDRKTGKITSIDLGTMLVGGARADAAGSAVKVLLGGSQMYVANLARGTVQAVDPATQASLGAPWTAGRALVDVGIDGRHDVWALDTASRLTTLRWTAARQALAPVAHRTVRGAGPGSVIVGHDTGVTVVGSHGTIVRAGTGSDTSLTAPDVSGPLAGPPTSPDDIVPVSVPNQSSVVIVGGSSAVVDDVAALGCPRPGAPTVFEGKVYVPCTGSHRVIVLTQGGQPAGPAITTPGDGDPQLTVSGGRLLIDVPGSDTATVVDGSGRAHDFPTVDPTVGVQNPSQPPPPPPPPPSPAPPHSSSPPPEHHGRGHGHQGGDVPSGGGHDGHDPGPSSSPSSPTSAPASPTSTGGTPPPTGSAGQATATARPDGTVLVSWTGPDAPGGFTVVLADTGAQVAQVPAGATSATVTVLDPGTTGAFVVHAYRNPGREAWSATTNSVTVHTAPGAASGVAYSVRAHDSHTARLAVTWKAAAGNGDTVTYTVAVTGSSASATTTQTGVTVDVPCAGSCSGTITVTASNSAGTAAPAQASYSVAGAPATQPAPPPPPATTTAAAPPPPPPPPPTTSAAPPPPPPPALPASGQSMIAVDNYTPGSTDDGPAEVTLSITMPNDWQQYDGSCTLQDNGATAQSLTCSQASSSVTLDYSVTATHSYTVVATGSAGTATSAAVSQRVVYTRVRCLNGLGARSLTGGPDSLPQCNQCPTGMTCQIPFLQLPPMSATPPARFDAVLRLGRVRWAR